jgi:DNA-directed RNA polymerase alpha subunit
MDLESIKTSDLILRLCTQGESSPEIIAEIDQRIPPRTKAPDEVRFLQAVLGLAIDADDLPTRALLACRTRGITRVGELVQMTEAEMKMLKGMGKKSMKDVRWFLKQMDLRLGIRPEDHPELTWPAKPVVPR